MDLSQYQRFVASATSTDSEDLTEFVNRLRSLDGNPELFDAHSEHKHSADINVPLLICGATGMSSETGELQDIVKKLLFQGKPLDAHTYQQLISELGDVLWYWVNACRALRVDPDVVIAQNVHKLQSHYPEGEFSVQRSEHRGSEGTS